MATARGVCALRTLLMIISMQKLDTALCIQVAEKSRGNHAREKEIRVLAKGLEEQHTSHVRMDHSKLADKQPGDGEVGGALDRLLHQSTDTSVGTIGLAAATTMTSGAMESTSDHETPGVSGIVYSI